MEDLSEPNKMQNSFLADMSICNHALCLHALQTWLKCLYHLNLSFFCIHSNVQRSAFATFFGILFTVVGIF